MRRLSCYSDIGSCLIGNKDWTFAVKNIGGDGETIISIFKEDNEEFKRYEEEHDLRFISSIQGTFNIYNYDCAFVYGCNDNDVIATLSGRYGVYQGEMEVAFVKWE